jgi:hypothetical protein
MIVTRAGNTKDANRRMPLFLELSYGIHPSFSESLIALLDDSIHRWLL